MVAATSLLGLVTPPSFYGVQWNTWDSLVAQYEITELCLQYQYLLVAKIFAFLYLSLVMHHSRSLSLCELSDVSRRSLVQAPFCIFSERLECFGNFVIFFQWRPSYLLSRSNQIKKITFDWPCSLPFVLIKLCWNLDVDDLMQNISSIKIAHVSSPIWDLAYTGRSSQKLNFITLSSLQNT